MVAWLAVAAACVVRSLLVGDVFAVIDDACGGVELFVVGVFDNGDQVDVLRQIPLPPAKCRLPSALV